MGKVLTLDDFKKIQKVKDYPMWVASRHHKTHKNINLNFKTHPYLTPIYLDKSEYLVIIKSTQNGISEYLLVRAIAHAIKGMRVFYVFPTFNLVKRFIDERWSKSIQHTEFYSALVKATKEEQHNKFMESLMSKDIGEGNIAFVNSYSEVGFTEYAADEVIIDELDQCDPDNIIMAWERLSHSDYRWQTKISNPKYKKRGIDAEYRNTDQMEYHVKCTAGHEINMDWFKHIVREVSENKYVIRDKNWNWEMKRDIYPICDKCGKPIKELNGRYIPLNPGSRKRGYRLTKLFSGTVSNVELLDRFTAGLSDDAKLQRFYNADLGQAYTSSGVAITEDMITACASDYSLGKEDGMVFAGIDVGKYYHYIIQKITASGHIKTIGIGKTMDTKQLISILQEYKIKTGVIDGLPETREARKISSKFPFMLLCYYGGNKKDSIDVQGKTITVQRTPAIDAVKEGLLTNTILYPHNIINQTEFVAHMTSSVRVFNPDKRAGGQIGAYEWIEDGDDHYLHASAYCLIARRLIILLSKKGK